jgi:hypothetical protein
VVPFFVKTVKIVLSLGIMVHASNPSTCGRKAKAGGCLILGQPGYIMRGSLKNKQTNKKKTQTKKPQQQQKPNCGCNPIYSGGRDQEDHGSKPV